MAHRNGRSSLLFFVLACLSAPGRALSADGALAFKLGSFFPGGESELWTVNTETFDFDVGDFNYLMGGVELDLELTNHLDIAIGFDGYSRRVDSTYRDFVRDDGTEIFQSFKLKVLPITGGLRFLPVGKFRRLIPHVALGAGLYYFDYQEQGDFINSASLQIFPGAFSDRGLVPGIQAGAGAEYLFSEGIDPGEGWYLFGQFRRHWVSAELAGDFTEEDLDLGGSEIAFGLSLRF
jgi:hypothetical protein